jgi:hypothetical protein
MANKDLLTRLTDAGEDAMNRFSDKPGIERALGFATNSLERLEEMSKKVRGIDALEKRVSKLEKQVASLAKAKRKAEAASTKRTAAGKGTTAKTGPASPG